MAYCKASCWGKPTALGNAARWSRVEIFFLKRRRGHPRRSSPYVTKEVPQKPRGGPTGRAFLAQGVTKWHSFHAGGEKKKGWWQHELPWCEHAAVDGRNPFRAIQENPGMTIPLQIPHNRCFPMVSTWCEIHFVHLPSHPQMSTGFEQLTPGSYEAPDRRRHVLGPEAEIVRLLKAKDTCPPGLWEPQRSLEKPWQKSINVQKPLPGSGSQLCGCNPQA